MSKLPFAAAALSLIAFGQQPPPKPPPQQPTPQQEPPRPTFRTGTNVVRVDVTVVDRRGLPVTHLTPEDFEVREDGQPQAITSFKLVEANGQPTDELSLPIRGPEHAAAEAARDDVRVFLFFWDEYHIDEHRSAYMAKEALTRVMLDAFGPTDLVAIMDPLTPTDAIRFTRDRRELANQVHTLKGRRGIYFPRSLVEEEQLRAPMQYGGIEVIRQQVTTSSIRAAAGYLGAIKDGRKSLILISETLGPTRGTTEYTDILHGITRAANDTNTAIYVFDPRGLQVGGRMSDMLVTIAYGTGGQPMVTNDFAAQFTRTIVNPASAFYLLGYAKEVAADGKFHEIKVRVKRSGLEVRARNGYWAPKLADVARATAAAVAAVLPPAVETAFASLRSARSRAVAEVWSGVSQDSQGRTTVTMAWTPQAIDDAPASAAAVSVTAKAGGVTCFEGDVAPTGTSFLAPAGAVELAITIRDEKGEVLDRIPRAITVPGPGVSPLALTTPAVMRSRNARELRENEAAANPPVHAGRDFERTDRVVVRFAVHGSFEGVTTRATLLDRRGVPLVELSVARDVARGSFRIDLPVSNIARGEYVVAIEASRAEEKAEAHVPFRVVR
jgi:VWFA-related protein